jgi:hypothetical protein
MMKQRGGNTFSMLRSKWPRAFSRGVPVLQDEGKVNDENGSDIRMPVPKPAGADETMTNGIGYNARLERRMVG